MTASATDQDDARSLTISLRVPRQKRDLIDRAARASGKTRTDFILESATRAAEDALLQQVFHLDAEAFAAFEHALDRPPEPSVSLRRLLNTPAPWDR
jgi:uncharacterized protein (DUF1778 family)